MELCRLASLDRRFPALVNGIQISSTRYQRLVSVQTFSTVRLLRVSHRFTSCPGRSTRLMMSNLYWVFSASCLGTCSFPCLGYTRMISTCRLLCILDNSHLITAS